MMRGLLRPRVDDPNIAAFRLRLDRNLFSTARVRFASYRAKSISTEDAAWLNLQPV